MYDWLIVGAGFAGSVLAERIATQRNENRGFGPERDRLGLGHGRCAPGAVDRAILGGEHQRHQRSAQGKRH